MSDEQYKDFKRELSKKSAFKDFAKAKAIKSVEDEAWEFNEKLEKLRNEKI